MVVKLLILAALAAGLAGALVQAWIRFERMSDPH